MPQDSQLQQALLAESACEPGVTAVHIGVMACEGAVTLAGHVGSFARKQSAEAAARRVKAVRAAAERIEVRLPSGIKRGDDKMVVAAVNRLSWDASVSPGGVKVQVENGWVTLSSQVDWNDRWEAVEQNIRTPLDVCGRLNEVTASTADLDNDINHALHRSWFLSPDDVQVGAEGGTVHLTGAAQAPHGREVVAVIAWAVPGAAAAVNDITAI